MKNRADNIIDILNLLRCIGKPNYVNIDKKEIFSYGKYIDNIRFKDGGEKLLQ